MSVHQYIGARYVPYYYENSLDPTSTEWEPNVNYEALTVVTLPNQHSYISKKAVPDTVGSPALNAEYWLDTGSENGYIQDLQNQIDDITDNVIPPIVSDVMDVKNDIAALDNITGHKFIFIADSYGNYTNTDGLNMIGAACDALGIASSDYDDIHIGSTGFSTTTPSNFADMLDSSTKFTSDEVTDIVVIGAANDLLGTKAAIGAGITNFYNIQSVKYPNAKVKVLFMSTSFILSEKSGSEKVDAMYSWYCGKYNYEYFDARYTLSFNTEFRSDMIHPNQASVNILANCLKSIIKNGKALAGDEYVLTPSAGTYFTGGVVTHGKMLFQKTADKRVVMSDCSDSGYVNAYCHITGTARTVGQIITDLFQTTDGVLSESSFGYHNEFVPVFVFMKDASNNYHTVYGILYASSVTNSLVKWSVLLDNDGNTSQVTEITVYAR